MSLQSINKIVGPKFSGETTTWQSANKVESGENGKDSSHYPAELLNSLTEESALPEQRLTLKMGFFVMLLYNIGPFEGHVNGERYIVMAVHTKLFLLDSLIDDNAGKILALTKMFYGQQLLSYPRTDKYSVSCENRLWNNERQSVRSVFFWCNRAGLEWYSFHV